MTAPGLQPDMVSGSNPPILINAATPGLQAALRRDEIGPAILA
jgi:hypothetical protein